MARCSLILLLLACEGASTSAPTRPDATMEIRVVGGREFLDRVWDVAEVPLWQELLPRSPRELAEAWVDVPAELTVRDDSTVIVLQVEQVVVVGVRVERGIDGVPTRGAVAALSSSAELARQSLPWLAHAMADKRKHGAYCTAPEATVRAWLADARSYWERHFRYVDDEGWRVLIDRVADTFGAMGTYAGPLNASLELRDGVPDVKIRVGDCAAQGTRLTQALPRGTAATWSTDGRWAGVGYGDTPFAWGTGEPFEVDVISCADCAIDHDGAAWSWGVVPERTVDTTPWAVGMHARRFGVLAPMHMRRLIDHTAGVPTRPMPWWRPRPSPVVVGWTTCDAGVSATVRAHSLRSLGILYIASTRHLH